MFNIWTYDDGLGAEKVRVPQRFGIGTAYVGPDAAFPTDTERQRATDISIKKGVVSPGTRWQTCASVDAVTGECAAFVIGHDAQPLPPWVTTGGPPPPGIIPPNIPVKGVQPKISQPTQPQPGPAPKISPPPLPPPSPPSPVGCPPGQRLIGMTQSFPGSPICEPISSGDGEGGTKPTQPSRPNQHRRLRDSGGRSSAVELCPLAGYVTRPVPGASEYQVYKCQPGERVPINLRFDPQRRGLQEAGIREALQRVDVSGQPIGIVSAGSAASSPNWLLIGGIAIGAFLLFGRKR